MGNIEKAARELRKTQDQSAQNARRVTENFLLPDRIVGSINRIRSVKTLFNMSNGKNARLWINFKPHPVACTVNPPMQTMRSSIKFSGDNPGVFMEPFTTTQTYNEDTEELEDDFTWTSEGVTVPISGCYGILWTSPAYGVGFESDKTVTVAILHNDKEARRIEQTTTGFLAILGPPIYHYTPASPVYIIVEALAGDIIGAFLTQEDISEGYPWAGGTELDGFFVSEDDFAATITIELVAVAEGY